MVLLVREKIKCVSEASEQACRMSQSGDRAQETLMSLAFSGALLITEQC